MKICYFGMYAADYSRNRILIKGLRQNGVDVIECNDRHHLVWGWRYWHLVEKYFSNNCHKAEVIMVGFPGQTDMPLAWLLAKVFRQKLVFDAFISLYNTQVVDRQYIKRDSLQAILYWYLDWLSCCLAGRVILDTNAHIDYFCQTFHLPRKKFFRIFVGTDPEIIFPQKTKSHEDFIVGFHGSFLPLQGVPIILLAAKVLETYPDIRFKILGDGIERRKCEQLAKRLRLRNVKFLDKIPYRKLGKFISSCDIYLGGPFAGTLKASLVIPNKVYEALAVKRPVIVGDSAATKELFINKYNCLLISQADKQKLVDAILELKNNHRLRLRIAENGYNLIVQKLTPKQVTSKLINQVYGLRS